MVRAVVEVSQTEMRRPSGPFTSSLVSYVRLLQQFSFGLDRETLAAHVADKDKSKHGGGKP